MIRRLIYLFSSSHPFRFNRNIHPPRIRGYQVRSENLISKIECILFPRFSIFDISVSSRCHVHIVDGIPAFNLINGQSLGTNCRYHINMPSSMASSGNLAANPYRETTFQQSISPRCEVKPHAGISVATVALIIRHVSNLRLSFGR